MATEKHQPLCHGERVVRVALNCSRTFAEMRRLVSALSLSNNGESRFEIVQEPHAGQPVLSVAR